MLLFVSLLYSALDFTMYLLTNNNINLIRSYNYKDITYKYVAIYMLTCS